jgi:hypothetical protein
LVETESFSVKGGWVVDQQFVHQMGSPYLLAHGMGVPVKDAETTIQFPESNEYYIWVRTKNWIPGNWQSPGRFKLSVNSILLPTEFGKLDTWGWEFGGKVNIQTANVTIKLHDLTGFEGRCDAIYFTTDSKETPPGPEPTLTSWRRKLSGLSDTPVSGGNYDVVVVGGGMAGISAAIAAARSGIKVALVQDRPYLGGNSSADVRVHTLGVTGKNIVPELGLSQTNTNEAVVVTQKRQTIVNNEPNITQFLSWRAFNVITENRLIKNVDIKHIESGQEKRLTAKLFIDCTGDGWIGYWAGNRYMMGRESKSTFNESLAPTVADTMMMGSTLLFNSTKGVDKYTFPAVPWAMDVAKDKVSSRNDWDWEYGIGINLLNNTEHIRDNLFRAIYGSYFNYKQIAGNEYSKLNWMA